MRGTPVTCANIMVSAAIIAAALLASAPEAAAQAGLAVVDTQFVVQTSEAGKSLRAQLDRQRAADERTAKAEEDNLTKIEQTLLQQRASLPADEFQKRAQDLRKKGEDAQRQAQDREARLETGYQTAAIKIENAIETIVTEIDRERSFVMAIRRSALAGNTTAPDITQEVLKRLNQRLPSVALELPK